MSGGLECARCGREFTGLSAFDRHQTTAYGTDTPVTCHDPAVRGLVQNARGRWGSPQTEDGARRLAEMRASRLLPQTESARQAGSGTRIGSDDVNAADGRTGR